MSVPSDETLLGLNRAATTARLQAGAVHEVNNALQVISGTIEILEGRRDLPPDLVQSLERLRNQSRRAAAAMAEVLVFTKAPRGSQGPVNVKEIATHSLALRQFAMKRARIASRLDADVGSYLVIGNRGDLQQAVLNVLINAEQAVQGSSGTIVVTLRSEPGAVVLRVEDSGGGFAIAPVDAVGPFKSTRDPYEYAGLGLWATKAIVDAHGGSVHVDSTPKGSIVTLRLVAGTR